MLVSVRQQLKAVAKERVRARIKFCLALVACVILVRSTAHGQATGGISGIVTDAQGAIIPGAEITVTNTATSVSNRTKTNNSGVFEVPYLVIGSYDVAVTASGMGQSVTKGVVVDQNNISRVDVTLRLGSTQQTVTVVDTAPLIEKESPTYDATLSPKFVDDLPNIVNGGSRDSTALAALVPGVSSGAGSFGVGVTGGRVFQQEFQLDGMSMSYRPDVAVPLSARPVQDVVAEVHVQVGVPSAEYGQTSSGVISEISRSGTNQLHGDGAIFLRNTLLDARAYNVTTRSTDQQFELPLSVGGPVYIPKLFNGKDRAFFFFNYTAYRRKSGGGGATATVPTALERSGNFTDFPQTIYDPTTGQPFPNNTIPQTRFSSTSQALLKYIPNPTNSLLSNNYNGSTPTSQKEKHYFTKLDYNINDKNRISGTLRFEKTGGIYAEPGPAGAFGVFLSARNPDNQDTQSVRLEDTYTATPTVVNRFAVDEIGFVAPQVGTPAIPVKIPGSYGAGFPFLNFSPGNGSGGNTASYGGYTSIGDQNTQFEEDRTFELQDDLSWVVGSHTLKFGVRWINGLVSSYTGGKENGIYNFSPTETGLAGVGGTGNAFASFLLGAVDNAQMYTTTPLGFRNNQFALYAQDVWKINRKLTLSYGLRWDMQPPYTEMHNRITNVDLRLPNPGAGGLPGASIFGGRFGTGSSTFVPTWHNGFGPRVGLAYSLTNSTVLRASAGIVYAPFSNPLDSNGFTGSSTLSSPGGNLPAFQWDAGWPANVVHYPPFLSPTLENGQTANVQSANQTRLSNTNVWQFDIQQNFWRGTLIDVGYLGQSSHHIPNSSLNNLNQVNPSYLSLGPLLNDLITNPAVAAAGFSPPYPGFTGTLAQALRPYPQYQTINLQGNAIGNANYNALLVKVEKRLSNGLQFLVSYTFSKALSDSGFGWYSNPVPQDNYNRKPEKILSASDIPNRLVLSYTYELPWGPGKRFLNKGFASQLLGGWAISGIQQYQSGTPVSINIPNSLPLFNGRLDANYLGGPITLSNSGRGNVTLANSLTGQAGTVVLNRAAFGFPAPYTFGNTYVLPNIRTLGQASENFSLFKRETFHERYVFEIGVDLFNAFNRKEFGNLDTTLSDPSFGQYTGAGLSPRAAQLRGKIVF